MICWGAIETRSKTTAGMCSTSSTSGTSSARWSAYRPSSVGDRGTPWPDPRRGRHLGPLRSDTAVSGLPYYILSCADHAKNHLACSRRWRRQTALPADAGSVETRGAVRRRLSTHRLCALQPRQWRLPQNRRADPVQEPQPRPPPRPHLANVTAAGQLRHPGAGADASRPLLVLRLSRRDLPELQHPHRRAPRPCHRVWRRSHLSHGSSPDDGAAHRVGRRRHGCRNPSTDRGGILIWCHRGQGERRDRFVPREAGEAQITSRCPRSSVRFDGELHLRCRGVA